MEYTCEICGYDRLWPHLSLVIKMRCRDLNETLHDSQISKLKLYCFQACQGGNISQAVWSINSSHEDSDAKDYED